MRLCRRVPSTLARARPPALVAGGQSSCRRFRCLPRPGRVLVTLPGRLGAFWRYDGGMPAVGAKPLLTYAEYLVLEESTELRHEFFNGEMLAMAGGTGAHARLKSNLHVAVGASLRGRACRPCDVDQRIRIPETGLSTYPDLSIVCGRRVPAPDDRHSLANPTVVFEVLSAGTAAYDHGEKFDQYAHLSTLKQYVLVDSERIHIDLYTRGDDGSWIRRGYGAGDNVPLSSVEITLSMDELYEGWAEEREIDAGIVPAAQP